MACEIISFSIIDESKEAFNKLDKVVKYFKRRGSRKKSKRSYWIRELVVKNIDNIIEEIEKERGEPLGVDKITIAELHETGKQSTIDRFINWKLEQHEKEQKD